MIACSVLLMAQCLLGGCEIDAGEESAPVAFASADETAAPAKDVSLPMSGNGGLVASAAGKDAADVSAAETVAAEPVFVRSGAARVGVSGKGAGDAAPRSVKITSERTDYDRKEGVIMFDRNVKVVDADYQLCSDQLYVFLDGTNDLKRIVAIGGVSITNESRVGTCDKAVYSRKIAKIVMYGDTEKGVSAKLVDNGKRRSEVEGRKITFWIDSEQVEVEGSTVTLDAGGVAGGKEAKKLLGR